MGSRRFIRRLDRTIPSSHSQKRRKRISNACDETGRMVKFWTNSSPANLFAWNSLTNYPLRTPHREAGCQTFRCRVASIDGEPPTTSNTLSEPVPNVELCVKFFFDRYIPVEAATDNPFVKGLGPSFWLSGLAIAEEYLRREDAMYKRLEMAQGSLLPMYYGAHRVSSSVEIITVTFLLADEMIDHTFHSLPYRTGTACLVF